MDNTGNVTKNGKQNVDPEVCCTASLKEDTDGREEDGKKDLNNCNEREMSLKLMSGPKYSLSLTVTRATGGKEVS